MLVLALASICLIAIAIATRTSAVWWILAITSCGIHDRIGAIMVRKAEAIGDRGAQERQHAGLRAVQA